MLRFQGLRSRRTRLSEIEEDKPFEITTGMTSEEEMTTRNLPNLRSKRGSKKRSVGKVDKYIKNIDKTEVQNWNFNDMKTQIDNLRLHSESYEKIQEQILDILCDKNVGGRLDEEEKEYEEQLAHHMQLKLKLTNLMAISQKYGQIQSLEHAVEDAGQLTYRKGRSFKDLLDTLTKDVQLVQRINLNPDAPQTSPLTKKCSELFSRIMDLKAKYNEENPRIETISTTPARVEHITSSHTQSRLPKIELSTFDGDILGWQSFWESFSSALGKDPSLTNADKLFYLRSSIRCEEGKAVVQNATGSGDDFDDIVMTLKKRFDRRREAYKIRVK